MNPRDHFLDKKEKIVLTIQFILFKNPYYAYPNQTNFPTFIDFSR